MWAIPVTCCPLSVSVPHFNRLLRNDRVSWKLIDRNDAFQVLDKVSSIILDPAKTWLTWIIFVSDWLKYSLLKVQVQMFFSFYKYCMRVRGIQRFIISSWSDKNDSYEQFFPLIGAVFKKSPEYRSPYDLLVVQIMCMKSFTEIPDFILIWQKNMAVMSNSCFWLVEIKKNLWNFKFKWSASLVTHEIKISSMFS